MYTKHEEIDCGALLTKLSDDCLYLKLLHYSK